MLLFELLLLFVLLEAVLELLLLFVLLEAVLELLLLSVLLELLLLNLRRQLLPLTKQLLLLQALRGRAAARCGSFRRVARRWMRGQPYSQCAMSSRRCSTVRAKRWTIMSR
jgi:hypothetical protein